MIKHIKTILVCVYLHIFSVTFVFPTQCSSSNIVVIGMLVTVDDVPTLNDALHMHFKLSCQSFLVCSVHCCDSI